METNDNQQKTQECTSPKMLKKPKNHCRLD